MSDIVLLHHNEPMTTSLAIAEGTENTHQAIMKMVKTYVAELQNFGRVGFEIQPFETSGGVQTREIAFLNEPQATLLITFLRNSEIVVRFKVALVKAFYELRARVAAAPAFTTRQLDHGADLAVAADRTFRSFLRAARSAGMKLPAALKVANRHTVERTGLDMLAALGVATEEPAPDALSTALSAWAETAEAGKHYALEAVLCDVTGITPRDRRFWREMARAGDILRGLGFRRVRIKHTDRQAALWTKEAA